MKVQKTGAIVIVVIVVVLACGRLRGPGQTVKAFYDAMNHNEYSKLDELLSDDTKNLTKSEIGVRVGGIKGLLHLGDAGYGALTNVQILNEQIRGEGATVIAKITYKDGSTSDSKWSLVKERGSWKINITLSP